jgi:SAM-dependent methyltransferase
MHRPSTAQNIKYLNRKVEYQKKLLTNTVPPSQIVRDLGRGNEAYCELLMARSKQVTNVDISRRQCQYAKSRSPYVISLLPSSRFSFRKRSRAAFGPRKF